MNTLRLSDYKDKLIHFIGIGGSSMSGLAELLTALGYQVRGDDRSQSHSTDKLIREGIPVVIGHDAKNVHGAGLVVYTAAIAPDNVERMECERLGIPQMERAELLGQISEHYPAFGCHLRHARQNHFNLDAVHRAAGCRARSLHPHRRRDRPDRRQRARGFGRYLHHRGL